MKILCPGDRKDTDGVSADLGDGLEGRAFVMSMPRLRINEAIYHGMAVPILRGCLLASAALSVEHTLLRYCNGVIPKRRLKSLKK